jgi:hypothetical protein
MIETFSPMRTFLSMMALMIVQRLPIPMLGIFAAAFALGACAGRPAPTAAPAPTRAAAAAAATAPAAAPASLRYAVGTGRYRFESRAHVEQEMMGQVNAADATTAALVTAVVAEAQGNLGVSLTIDSLGDTAPIGGVDDAQLAAARGKTVRLVVDDVGDLHVRSRSAQMALSSR